LYALSDGEVRGAVVGAAAVLARAEAAFLDLVAGLDSRPEAVPGTRPGQGAAAFLHQVVLRSPGQVFRDVAAARAIDGIGLDAAGPAGAGAGGSAEDGAAGQDGGPDGVGGLPVMVAAFRSGQVSRQHLDVAVRTLGKVPAHLASTVDGEGRTGAKQVDSYLTEHSRIFPPSGTERLGRHLLAVLNPDGLDRFDPAAFQRRSLTWSVDGTGMLVGRFQLDPASGACLKAALDRFSAPHAATPVTSHDDGSPDMDPDLDPGPGPEGGVQGGDVQTGAGQPEGAGTGQTGRRSGNDGDAEQGVLLPDGRTRAQRQADGLTAIARMAMAADEGTVRAEPRTSWCWRPRSRSPPPPPPAGGAGPCRRVGQARTAEPA
jgi:hypothetical protein